MESRRLHIQQMDLKERQQVVKAMWNVGLTRAEIARELGLTYSQVNYIVQLLDLHQTKRHYHRGESKAEIMTLEDVEYFKLEHPPGSTVQDEDGKKYTVVQSYGDTCEVAVSKHYKTCLRWHELTRVDWNLKRGRNPKMEEGGSYEDDYEED